MTKHFLKFLGTFYILAFNDETTNFRQRQDLRMLNQVYCLIGYRSFSIYLWTMQQIYIIYNTFLKYFQTKSNQLTFRRMICLKKWISRAQRNRVLNIFLVTLYSFCFKTIENSKTITILVQTLTKCLNGLSTLINGLIFSCLFHWQFFYMYKNRRQSTTPSTKQQDPIVISYFCLF